MRNETHQPETVGIKSIKEEGKPKRRCGESSEGNGGDVGRPHVCVLRGRLPLEVEEPSSFLTEFPSYFIDELALGSPSGANMYSCHRSLTFNAPGRSKRRKGLRVYTPITQLWLNR